MTHTTCKAGVLTALCLLLGACASTDQVHEQKRYVLDVGQFVESMVDSVKQQHDNVDPAAEQRYRKTLSTAFFTLDLRDDGLFRAEHGIGERHHVFGGRWELSGHELIMHEFVRNGKKVSRTSKATLEGDTITMSGQRGDVQVFYVLRKLDTIRGQRGQRDQAR